MKLALAGLAIAMMGSVANAAIKKESVEYKDGKTTLQGYMVYDDAWTGKRPAIMIVHQWMGLTDNEKMRAEKLAEEGYVAFAVDIYGKDVRPTTQEEAGKTAGSYKGNPKLFKGSTFEGYPFRGEIRSGNETIRTVKE